MTIHRSEHLSFLTIKTSDFRAYASRPHFHETLSVKIMAAGTTRVTLGKEVRLLGPGDYLVVPPRMVHFCEPDPEMPFSFINLYIDAVWGRGFFFRGEDAFRVLEGRLSADALRELEALPGALRRSGEDPWASGEVLSFLERLGEGVSFLGGRASETSGFSGPGLLCQEIMSLIEEDLGHNTGLEEIASRMGYDRFYLLRLFRRETGVTIHRFLMNRRINEAERLLLRGKRCVDVALRCGFSSQSHFISTFRQFTGTTPEAYRCHISSAET